MEDAEEADDETVQPRKRRHELEDQAAYTNNESDDDVTDPSKNTGKPKGMDDDNEIDIDIDDEESDAENAQAVVKKARLED